MKCLLLNRDEIIAAKGLLLIKSPFLFLSQCFQKTSAADASKRVCEQEMFMTVQRRGHVETTGFPLEQISPCLTEFATSEYGSRFESAEELNTKTTESRSGHRGFALSP